jgi:anti-anti-sigma regulatory factor
MGWFDAGKPRKLYGSSARLDGVNYYVLVFPSKLTYDRADMYREVAQELARGDLPVLLDFSQVEQFDTSGLAFIHALVIDQVARPFFHKGMPPVVRNIFDVYGFSDYLRMRVQPLTSKANLDARVA